MFCWSLIITADICQCWNCCPHLLWQLTCLQCVYSISLSPKFPIMTFSHNVFEEVRCFDLLIVSHSFESKQAMLITCRGADVTSKLCASEAVLGLLPCTVAGRHCQTSFDVCVAANLLYLFLIWSNSKDVSSLQSRGLLQLFFDVYMSSLPPFSKEMQPHSHKPNWNLQGRKHFNFNVLGQQD